MNKVKNVNLYMVVFLLIFLQTSSFAKQIDMQHVAKQVEIHNNSNEFEQTIELLEGVISNKQSSAQDKYEAYFLKYLTYKRLFSYDRAKVNLDLALEQGLKTDNRSQIVSQMKFENLFIAFDLLQFDKVKDLLQTINQRDYLMINIDTQAMYLSILAVMHSKEGHFQKAISYLDKAIKLLEVHDPKNLPLIYRKKIDIYRQLNQHDKAIESFDKGLYYAKKYNIDIYILNMYYDLTYYYKQIGDLENAIIAQEICNELAAQYNEGVIIGRLNILESELQKKRIDKQNSKNTNFTILLISIAFILVVVLVILYWYNKKVSLPKVGISKEKLIVKHQKLQPLPPDNQGEMIKDIPLGFYQLSERQLEIIELVKKGKTNKEIASDLCVSQNTVKYHLKNIYKILRVKQREEL